MKKNLSIFNTYGVFETFPQYYCLIVGSETSILSISVILHIADYKPYKAIDKSNTCRCNLNGDLSCTFAWSEKSKVTVSYCLNTLDRVYYLILQNALSSRAIKNWRKNFLVSGSMIVNFYGLKSLDSNYYVYM